MARRGYTEKEPCHGCGEVKLRPKDRLCDKCQTEIDWARAERKRLEGLRGVELRWIAPYENSIPNVYTPNHVPVRGYDEYRHMLRNIMYRIVHAMIPAFGGAGAVLSRNLRWDERISLPKGMSSVYEPIYVALPPGVADAIDMIVPTVEAMVAMAHQAGREEGRSLVGQLAEGRITLDELGESDANYARHVQKIIDASNGGQRQPP